MKDSINLVKTLSEKGNYKDALRQYFAIVMRAEQDSLCGSFLLADYYWKMVRRFEIDPIISKYNACIYDFMTPELELEVAEQIKDKTENDRLDDPYIFYENTFLICLNKMDRDLAIDVINTYKNQTKDNRIELPKEPFSLEDYFKSLFVKYKDEIVKPSGSWKQIRADCINNKVEQIKEFIHKRDNYTPSSKTNLKIDYD